MLEGKLPQLVPNSVHRFKQEGVTDAECVSKLNDVEPGMLVRGKWSSSENFLRYPERKNRKVDASADLALAP